MTQQTGAQTRVINPILSEHARGYRNATLVGSRLFPLAPVATYGGNIIEFGKEAFRLYSARRAPGAATKRIRFGHTGKPFSIPQNSLEAVVPREIMQDASQVPGINLATRAVNVVLRSILLEHEYNCSQVARNAANYDNDHKLALTGNDRWTSETSDPIKDVLEARQAIRRSIGVYPNSMEIGPSAMAALQSHPDLVARASTSATRVVDVELLRRVFQVQNIFEGEATVATGADDALGDVWGDDVVLAYVSPGASVDANVEEPSYGYTYLIDGHPLVEEPYYDSNIKSWVYGVSHDNVPVLSGMLAGFLLQNAGAAP